jgi:Zn-dependent M28 family amino/carboxypeptidase
MLKINALAGICLLACVMSSPLLADEPRASISPELNDALSKIQAPNIAAHINRLASDEFAGRAPGTRGETLTIEYLAAQLAQYGLKPGNPDGTFFQKVPLVGYQSVPKIEIEVGGQKVALTFLDDFVHDRAALKPRASAKNAAVVFAGYGIVAPLYGWDDYKDVDVRNKLVIVLGGEPAIAESFKGDTRTWFSSRDFKFDLAAAKGAAGILIVTDPEKSHAYSVFQTFAKMEGGALKASRGKSSPLIAGLITIGAARRLMSAAGQDFDQLQAAASKPDARPVVTSANANISVDSKIRHFVSHNVVARIEGSDPRLKVEYVVYSAHWDHLGTDPNLTGDQIYNGAIDNAAGTSQLLEIARGFAALRNKPKRSILFMAVTAEEKDFLGSRFYVEHPLVPLSKTVANINLDGGNVWGVTSDLITTGYGLSTLDEALAEAARLQGRTFIKEAIDDGGLYFASDQIEFAKVGIPAAFPFSGSEYVGKPKEFGDAKWDAYSSTDYHQVTDEVKPDWDLTGAAEDAKWLMIAGDLVADSEQRPDWKPGSEFARK